MAGRRKGGEPGSHTPGLSGIGFDNSSNMTLAPMPGAAPLPWQADEIAYQDIDRSAVAADTDLMIMVAAASFIEIVSDVTTGNLACYFADDDEVVGWLTGQWEQEELQHGNALRRYVEAAWPHFDWERAYQGFAQEYKKLLTVDAFERTRGLELAARCVIETGTATYYTALEAIAPEPVLKDLARRIHTDEVRHYKHFLGFFTRYRRHESLSRWRVLGALKKRLLEARSDDADIALWHAFQVARPDQSRTGPEFAALIERLGLRVRTHLPVRTAARMLLKPLALPSVIARRLDAPLAAFTQRFVLR